MRQGLDWATFSWDDLVRGATAYRDAFSAQAREDRAYHDCRFSLEGRDLLVVAGRSGDIVTFLNKWACRLPVVPTLQGLHGWIREQAGALTAVRDLHLADASVPGRADEIDRLYDDLMASLKPRVNNWSDAAASKTLHQLAPELFVMWDRAIRDAARAGGYTTYGEFTVGMHEIAIRALASSGLTVAEATSELQRTLGYQRPKTLAKYLDESNWYWLVGVQSSLHGA